MMLSKILYLLAQHPEAQERLHMEIAEAMQGVGKAHRVFLAACGSKSLMNAVRESADTYKTGNGYRIDVHCEDFGGC